MSIPFIKKSDYLYGIKYWAQWFPIGIKPRFEVFVYGGTQPDTGTHIFYAKRNNKVVMYKSLYQLNLNGFVPFLIDIKKVDEYIESRGWYGPVV